MIRLCIDDAPDADVIVVGSGPGGSAAAAHLAEAGVDVLLLDRSSFPRDKVCGDFAGPAALVELRELGVTDDPAYQRTNKIREAALYLDGKKLITRSLPEIAGLPAYGRVIPRTQLDAFVLEQATGRGARLLEHARVSGYEHTGQGVTVFGEQAGTPFRLRSRAVVGADGSSSVIARQLRGAPPAREDRIVAVRAYVEGIAGPAEQADLYFTSESFPGYYWLFPTGAGQANLGVGMLLGTMPPTEDRLRELLLSLVARDPGLAKRLNGSDVTTRIVGWPLTTYNPRQPISADRLVLVGDAAGLINPLNGEGIQYALQSGRWAAEVLVAALDEGDLSRATLRGYDTRVAEELRYDMALAALIVQLIRNRHLNPVWLHALRIIVSRARSDPDYAHVVGSVLAGLIPASDAVSRSVIIGTIEQAAVSLGTTVVWHGLRGPRHVVSMGGETARATLEMLLQTARDPVALAGWGAGVAGELVELGSQLARRWIGDAAADQRSRPIM